MVREVKALGLETCATLGMLKDGQAEQLRDAGLDYYNHNLDTAPEFYGEIITTRDYDDRLDTLERVRDAGIQVCCGGIVGMGETRAQRAGLIAQLANLDPQPESVPINHLVQVEGTPLHARCTARPRSIRSSSCAPSPSRASRCRRRWCACRPAGARWARRCRRCASSPAPTRSSTAKAADDRQPGRRCRPRAASPSSAWRRSPRRRDRARPSAHRRARRERARRTRARRAAAHRGARSQSPQGPHVASTAASSSAFASNDYLGLADAPGVVAAACAGARRAGASAPARRIWSAATTQPHEALEHELAAFVAPVRGARALSFSSGYMANLAILTALAGRGDAVFADRLNHAWLNDGALLSRARTSCATRMATSRALRAAARRQSTRAAQADRDRRRVQHGRRHRAAAASCSTLADAHDAWLVVDDAHGFGVLGEGRGSLAHFGLASERIIYMGTLGKAAGRGRRVRRGASGGDRDAAADRASLHLHDRRAAAARRALRASLALIATDAPRAQQLRALIARFRAARRATCRGR